MTSFQSQTIISIISLLIGGGIVVWILKFFFKLGTYSEKFDNLTETDKRMEKKIDDTKDKVGEISGIIIEMQDGFRQLGYPMQRILKTTSPISLTDYGKKLLEESGFYPIFNQNRDKLIQIVKDKNPKTKYDAQEFSREMILSLKDDPMFAPLKQYAFKEGASFEQILRAGAIPLRDAVIERLDLKE